MTRRRLLGFAAAAAFAVSACGASSDGSTVDSPTTEATTEATTDAAAGATSGAAAGGSTSIVAGVPEVLQFAAPLVGGGTYDGASAAGKVTAYWFWAPT